MFTISCGVKADYIVELLDGQTHEGVTFKFEEKKGIQLVFSFEGAEKAEAIAVAKKVIKSTEVGSVLYFQIA